MPSNMPLPFSNGRPPGPSPRNGFSAATPNSASIFMPTLLNSSDSSDAVLEKHRLTTRRSAIPFLGPLNNYFSPYPVPLPFTTRKLLLSREPPATLPLGPHRRERSLKQTVVYGLGILAIILLAFSRIRSAIRDSARGIPLPFKDPSTLILTDQEIRRIWEWEISNGHYPSKHRLPTVVRLERLGNPGLPKKNEQLDGELPSRILQQGQLRAPPAFLDDVVPIGHSRVYTNLTQPRVYNPSSHTAPPLPYPPRPIPNGILDLDVVMEHCDFSTNQYVRDCLEMLRIGGGLDPEKRVRRGDTARWRHIYLEKDTNGELGGRDVGGRIGSHAEAAPLEDPEALSEQTMRAAGYKPLDVMEQLRSPKYPQLLAQTQRTQSSASNRRGHTARHPTHPTADPTCDADYPRLYHIFWAGPFSDKPYLAVLSFLFTQNLGLDLPLAGKGSPDSRARREEFLDRTCRPQLWIWINPGPAAAVPNPNARGEMLDDLGNNPWSAPFLHPRFSEVVKFKMWNTTEQLDGVPELRDHWRDLPLFNSGGVKYGGAPAAKPKAVTVTKEAVTIGVTVAEAEATKRADKDGDGRGEEPDVVEEELGRFGEHTRGEQAIAEDMTRTDAVGVPSTDSEGQTITDREAPSPIAPVVEKKKDELFERVGSTSSKGYDRLSVVLSDMARFVLCHRFGGTYLDADTILLKDWEELWGWKGQFAYRWSRLEKYNTAVLRLHRHSAMGSFLFKTALANGLDFHPMTISRYTKDAYLEGLLLRLPDALFDSAWLNTEYYQRDRPPFPYFKRFEDFFDPPKENDAGPAAVGFDGFFRGAFSYHFHNFWWIPFDPSRNWPDLGPRFAQGEKQARAKVMAAKMATNAPPTPSATPTTPGVDGGKVPANAGPTGGAGGRVAPTPLKTGRELEEELIATMKLDADDVIDDERDLGWATVLKRTFEAYLRGERPNMYGEWLDWDLAN